MRHNVIALSKVSLIGAVLFVLAAHSLEIADRRQGAVFRFHEEAFRGSVQQS